MPDHDIRKTAMNRLGIGLYFLALALSISSLAIPSWATDREAPLSSSGHSVSLWDTAVRLCLGPTDGPWRCYWDFVDMSKVAAARVVLCLSVVVQGVACLVVMVNSIRSRELVGQYFAESLAGLATQLSVIAVLIFHSVTHYAVNLTYGPGFAMAMLGQLSAYLGLIFTGLASSEPTLSARPDPSSGSTKIANF